MSEQTEVQEYSPEETALRDALRVVVDPELGMSVVELGLIRKVEFKPDMTELTVIMTTPFCPYGPALIEQIRRAAEGYLKSPVKLTTPYAPYAIFRVRRTTNAPPPAPWRER